MPKSLNIGNYHTRTIESKNTLTLEQVKKLIEGSKGSKIHLMILFNVVMGLRCSEIIGIKYSDIDFVEQKLTVRRQLGRDIKKNDSELDAKTYTKQEIATKTPSSVRTIDIRDIVYVRWHDLRGTCATILLLNGMSPKAIAENLGHASEIVTIDNYIDKSKLSVVKLDRLDSFIAAVVPMDNNDKVTNDFSKNTPDIGKYIMG